MIKNFIYALIILSVSPFQCSNDENEYTNLTINTPNLVDVENNQTVFSLNEYIIVNTHITNNQIVDKKQTINVSDYVHSNENKLSYWLYFYQKDDNGNYIAVNAKEMIAENGDVYHSNLIYGASIINPFSTTTDSYSSKIKFKMLETGTFYIGGGYYDGYTQDQRISISSSNEINEELLLTTSILNAKKNGLYEFKVE